MRPNKIKRYEEVSNNASDVNNLTTDDIFNFMELYFNKQGVLYSHLYNSFNKFIDEDVKSFLENGDHVFHEHQEGNFMHRYKFKYENVTTKHPVMDNDSEIMFPYHARTRSLIYAGKIVAKVTQLHEVTIISSGEKIVHTTG